MESLPAGERQAEGEYAAKFASIREIRVLPRSSDSRSSTRQARFCKTSCAKVRVEGTSVRVDARVCQRPLPAFGTPPKSHARFAAAEI